MRTNPSVSETRCHAGCKFSLYNRVTNQCFLYDHGMQTGTQEGSATSIAANFSCWAANHDCLTDYSCEGVRIRTASPSPSPTPVGETTHLFALRSSCELAVAGFYVLLWSAESDAFPDPRSHAQSHAQSHLSPHTITNTQPQFDADAFADAAAHAFADAGAYAFADA